MDYYERSQAKKIEAIKDGNLDNRDKFIIHPIFWIQFVDSGNGYIVQQRPSHIEAEYKDFVPRELGISRMVVENNRLVTALTDPHEYLHQKNQDIHMIGEKLADVYQDQYVKYVNSGFSISQSRRSALQFAESLRSAYMHEHEIKFPVEITQKVMHKLKKKREVK